MIEKGVALGVLKGSEVGNRINVAQDEQNKNMSGKWSLSKEVAKIIEVGIAVGVNFNGCEESLEVEIRRRKSEDDDRFCEQHG